MRFLIIITELKILPYKMRKSISRAQLNLVWIYKKSLYTYTIICTFVYHTTNRVHMDVFLMFVFVCELSICFPYRKLLSIFLSCSCIGTFIFQKKCRCGEKLMYVWQLYFFLCSRYMLTIKKRNLSHLKKTSQ